MNKFLRVSNYSALRASVFLLFLIAGKILSAQDYLSGKLTDKTASKEILYDRTQNDISFNIFQTIYKVTDLQKKNLFTVTLTNNRSSGNITVGIRTGKSETTGKTISYSRTEDGLILSDRGNLDTAFNLSVGYNYLVSFVDTQRTYPVLHKLKTADNKNLLLDPLSKIRLKKNVEVVVRILANLHRNLFNEELITLRDSLYKRQLRYNEAIETIRKKIEEDIKTLLKNKRINADEKRYVGEKRFGGPHGKGLLVLNGNIYDGLFKEAKFVSGNALFHIGDNEYCGEYAKELKNGTGSLKYDNGSYTVGIFVDDVLREGVSLQKEKNGEVYFGGYNGKRNGYGELQNANGGKYAGVFANGRLIKGYAKEVDPFGYYTYSRIENGIKSAIDAKAAEDFFGLALSSEKEED
jgi:hypothetical protein